LKRLGRGVVSEKGTERFSKSSDLKETAREERKYSVGLRGRSAMEGRRKEAPTPKRNLLHRCHQRKNSGGQDWPSNPYGRGEKKGYIGCGNRRLEYNLHSGKRECEGGALGTSREVTNGEKKKSSVAKATNQSLVQ